MQPAAVHVTIYPMNDPMKSPNKKRPMRSIKEKSCGVILYRNSSTESGEAQREYLLLHYPGGHWDFPKGHVEKIDVNEKATARRELLEETGIDNVHVLQGYREPMYYEFDRGKKERVKKTVVYFVARTDEEDITLSHEHQNFIWLPYQESVEKLTFDNAKELLRSSEEFLIGRDGA